MTTSLPNSQTNISHPAETCKANFCEAPTEMLGVLYKIIMHKIPMCVCVCGIYVYLTFILFHIISDANYLRLPTPFAIPSIRRLRCLTSYTPISFLHPIQVLELFSSCPFHYSSLDLTMPGRELWSLPNTCRFVVRAAEEQAVRPHYR